MVQRHERRVGGEDPRHLRIQIDERDRLDRRMLQQLADGESVAAAEHEDAPRGRTRRKPRVYERLMIAVLVAGAELEVRVEPEPEVVLPGGQHDPLVARVAREDHLVGVDAVLGEVGDLRGAGHPRREEEQYGDACAGEDTACTEVRAKEPYRPEGDAGVDDPEQERRSHEPEVRHEEDRKSERGSERAEIVEGENVGDDVLERVAVLEDPHQQRDLQPDEHAKDRDEHVEHEPERAGVREGEKEDRGREPADQPDEQLDGDEPCDEAAREEPRQPASHPHGEEVGPDHRGELRHAVAEQIARERARDELVDQPARGDEEDGEEEGESHERPTRLSVLGYRFSADLGTLHAREDSPRVADNRKPRTVNGALRAPQCTAAAMMIASAMATAPISTPIAVFWSSISSFQSEPGVSLSKIMNATMKSTTPMMAKMTAARALWSIEE